VTAKALLQSNKCSKARLRGSETGQQKARTADFTERGRKQDAQAR